MEGVLSTTNASGNLIRISRNARPLNIGFFVGNQLVNVVNVAFV